jgi:putative DNA primase/helicase
MTEDNAVPQDASDSLNPGPPLRNFDDDHPIVREATAIVTGHDPNEEERLSPNECKIIKADADPSDTGNAERLVDLFGDQIRYASDIREWFIYEDGRWSPDIHGRIVEMAKEVSIREFERADALIEENTVMSKYEAKLREEWAWKSRQAGHISSMISLAGSDPKVEIQSTDFDCDPWLLGCANGVVDLRTGELRQPDPTDLITKSTGVPFDPSATSPNWAHFISWAMLDREEMVSYFQKLLGYSLCGVVSERIVISMYGTGGNGKTTALNAMRVISGDYGLAVASKTFEAATFASGGGSADPHITQLKGARVVRTSEVEDGMQVATNTLKVLAGNDEIVGRDLYAKRTSTFDPTFTLWIAANSKLQVPADDQAIWDRMRFIPFEARITDDAKDKEIDQKLAAEAPGILAWAVRGCLDWQAQAHLNPPAVIEEATKAYRSEMDYFTDFLEAMDEMVGKDEWLRSEWHEQYVEYARKNGLPKLNAKAFRKQMFEHGYTETAYAGHKRWKSPS